MAHLRLSAGRPAVSIAKTNQTMSSPEKSPRSIQKATRELRMEKALLLTAHVGTVFYSTHLPVACLAAVMVWPPAEHASKDKWNFQDVIQ
ncbi:hypothetical protein LY76DRAFT_599097 [Colletotrichum caudatum]|nr:hypothetical protein LY76DRAFT_599097 [Colletotrichum caudatum]